MTSGMPERHHTSWRERVLYRLPIAAIEYPFELLLGWMGAVVGTPLAIGIVRSESMTALLPDPVPRLWGGLLLLAAATTLLGLWRRSYGALVPAGLRLFAFSCTAYALSVGTIAGLSRSAPSLALIGVIVLLCVARSYWLRTRDELAARINRWSR